VNHVRMNRKFNTLQNTLGRNVRRLRRELNLSQEELAFQAEIDRTYVSQIERGVINPSLLVLWKVSCVLGVDVAALLEQSKA